MSSVRGANPSTGEVRGRDATTDTLTTITQPEARLWAHLFNVRYRKLLVSLAHAFELATDRTDLSALSPRGWLIHHCFAEMYNLRAVAGLLVRLPVAPTSRMARGPAHPSRCPTPGLAVDRGEPLAGAPEDTLDAADRLYGQLPVRSARTAMARPIWPPSPSWTRSSAARSSC